MINLIPAPLKKNIVYARRNGALINLAFIELLVIVGIIVITMAGLFFMNQSIKSYNQQVSRSQETLTQQQQGKVQKQVEEISNNLKLATQVLSKEVLFSKLIQQIGAAMPPNTILTDLKIGTTDGGLDLTAAASSYESATQVQVNLQDPKNKIFDKVDLINTTCNASSTDPRYPCSVSLRARFSKQNSFTFTSGVSR